MVFDSQVYRCRKCGIRITSPEATILTDPKRKVMIFQNQVNNVKIDDEEKKWEHPHNHFDHVHVHCLGCDSVLGLQFLEVRRKSVQEYERGRFSLSMNSISVLENVAPPLIEFEQSKESEFFLCRKCQTHIVLNKATKYIDPIAKEGIFEDKLVNVEESGKGKKVEDKSHTHVEVSCLGCHTVLGIHMIDGSESVISEKRGYCCLSLSKLIKWDGVRLVYADSGKPVQG